MKINEINRIPQIIKELSLLKRFVIQIRNIWPDDSFMAMIANVHEFGCTIKPKGEYLTIPLSKKYKGKSPRDFDLFFMQTKEGHKLLVMNKGKEQLEFAYMLTEKMTIPERSFLRSTFDEKNKEWSDYSLTLVKKVVDGELTANELMNHLGLRIQRDVQRTIRNLSDPPKFTNNNS